MSERIGNMNEISQQLFSGAVGFLQFDVQTGEIDENLARLNKELTVLAPKGPGIVVLPELWATGFAYDNLSELALRTPFVLEDLTRLCNRFGVYLAGSLPEAVLTEIGYSIYNTLFIVGPGGVEGSYRKQHLFAPMDEDVYFTAGDNPHPIDTPLGRVGALVCFDLRFPDLARSQAACGAGILVVSAQWPAARTEHWRTLLRARAIENQVFVVGCNRCGKSGDIEFGGHSMIVAPDGGVLAEAADVEQGKAVRIEPALQAEIRKGFSTVGAAPYRFHDQNKMAGLDDLKPQIDRYKALGRKVVFTNGCFDILHVGHVTYLEAARKEGDCLIVGLNSDSSVRALGKGSDRPVNSEENRARLLAALGCVDHVVVFEEETPFHLISALMPDVLVKGGDWPVDKIVGASEVLANGGRVLSIPLVDDFSTTSLLEKIRETLSSPV